MNDLKIFNNEKFGSIRTMLIDNKPYVVGKDIAVALGYTDPSSTISKKCKMAVKRTVSAPCQNGNVVKTQTTFIPESDIYRLIFGSKLPEAEKFQNWVFEEVLPSIRKYGGYIIDKENETPEEIMARALIVAQATLERRDKKILELESKIEEQKPMVSFAKQIGNSSDLIDVGEFSKIIRDENINIGRNRLFHWLKENKILMKTNVPYQKFIEKKWFTVNEVVKKTSYGDKIFPKTLITGVGQIKLLEKIKEEFGVKDDE